MTPLHRRILNFEKRHYAHASNKEQGIRDEFGLSATRYYQVLVRLIADSEAVEAEPVLVNRLQRIMSQRVIARAGS